MENKKAKVPIILITIITLLVLGAIAGGVFLLPKVIQAGIELGESEMTIKSIDFVDRISNDNQLQDSHYRILTQIGIGGEEIVGKISKKDLEDGKDGNDLPDDWKAEFPLEIRARIFKETAIYEINADDSPAGKFYSFIWFEEEDPNPFNPFERPLTCDKSDKIQIGDIILMDNEILGGNRFCLIQRQIGKSGNFDLPTVKVDVEFSFKAEKTSKKDIISNFGEDSGTREILDKRGNRIGAVRMTQASDSVGANPPNQDNFRAVFVKGKGEWIIIKESIWQDYREKTNDLTQLSSLNFLESEIDNCKGFTPSQKNKCAREELQNYNDNINSDETLIITSSESFDNGDSSIVQDGEDLSTVEYIPNQIKLTNVELLFEAEAEWIGIRTLVSKPKIVNIDCPEFQSGKEGIITVDVKNVGAVTSVFDVDIFGSTIFRQTEDVAQQSIKAGDTKRFEISIDGGDLTEGEDQPTVIAFNVERPTTLFDQDTVLCKMTTPGLCLEGEQITSKVANKGICVFECKEGSYEEEPSFCCKDGIDSFITLEGLKNYECRDDFCIKNPDDPRCEEAKCGEWIKLPDALGGGTLLPDLFCIINNFFLKFKVTFAIVTGFIAFLLGWLYSRSLSLRLGLASREQLRKRWYIPIIIGLVFGVALGILGFLYFWTIMITLIVLALIKAFVPGI